MPRCHFSLAIIFLASLLTAAGRAAELGIRVPAGFVASQFATDELAHDIYSMTFDDRGRLFVSGRGYIKILEDEDEDGRAERAKVSIRRGEFLVRGRAHFTGFVIAQAPSRFVRASALLRSRAAQAAARGR